MIGHVTDVTLYKSFIINAMGYATHKDKSLIREEDMYCDFCGRNAKTVNRLLAGEDGYICDECVEQCCEVLKEEYGNEPKGKK